MPLRTVHLTLAAFAFSTLLVASLAAQQPKVLAPHREIPPLLPVSLQWERPATLHSIVGGLWMIDANFKSSIYLRNDLKIAPITVTPILYLSNGRKYTLDEVRLEASGTAVVSIGEGLRQKGISPWATLSGYVEVQYTWPWSAICASVQSVDAAHSLIFSYGLSELSPVESGGAERTSQAADQTLEGLWWKQESNVAGFIALSNTTSRPIDSTVQVSDASASVLGQHTVTVSPHGTRFVDLSELETAPTSEGGIRIHFKGSPESLIVFGGVEDKTVGYSAGLQFRTVPLPSAKTALETYAVPGLMTGAADPMMSFPAGTEFAPYTVLRNVSEQPISVVATVHWTEGGTARSAQLGTVLLRPLQTQSLNVRSMMLQAGLKELNGSFNLVLEAHGSSRALLMATGSVDSKNTYVFEVRPDSVTESMAKLLSYWSTGNGDDTMVNLWNPADEPQELMFTLTFAGGHYRFPIHLEPKASRMFNVSEIIHNQIPDEEGNTIPPSVHEGGAELSGARAENEYILVALASGVFNVQKATCGIYCQHCDGYQQGTQAILANPFAVAVSGQNQLKYTVRLHSGGTTDMTAYSTWSSSNTPVATVSKGLVNGISAGTLDTYATTPTELIYTDICNGNPPPCSYDTLAGGSPGTSVTAVVTLNSSGQVSATDGASTLYKAVVGTLNLGILAGTLGVNNGCVGGNELVGTVQPSTSVGPVTVMRTLTSEGCYQASTAVACSQGVGDDTGDLITTNPQDFGANGQVYNLDTPGILGLTTTIPIRVRYNFTAYAVGPDGTTQISPNLAYYVRVSCNNNSSGVAQLSTDVSGDNQIGLGTTKTTWNLQ